MTHLCLCVWLTLCPLARPSGSPATARDVVERDAAWCMSPSPTVTSTESRDVVSQEAVFSTVLEPQEGATQRAVAEQLARVSGRSVSWVQGRFRILRKASGSGIYVQVDAHPGPVEVVFRPTAGGTATLLRGVERAPSMRVPRDVRDRSVVLFRVGQGDTPRYEFSVPGYITSATVVVNGRLVAESRALSTERATTVRAAPEGAAPEAAGPAHAAVQEADVPYDPSPPAPGDSGRGGSTACGTVSRSSSGFSASTARWSCTAASGRYGKGCFAAVASVFVRPRAKRPERPACASRVGWSTTTLKAPCTGTANGFASRDDGPRSDATAMQRRVRDMNTRSGPPGAVHGGRGGPGSASPAP